MSSASMQYIWSVCQDPEHLGTVVQDWWIEFKGPSWVIICPKKWPLSSNTGSSLYDVHTRARLPLPGILHKRLGEIYVRLVRMHSLNPSCSRWKYRIMIDILSLLKAEFPSAPTNRQVRGVKATGNAAYLLLSPLTLPTRGPDLPSQRPSSNYRFFVQSESDSLLTVLLILYQAPMRSETISSPLFRLS